MPVIGNHIFSTMWSRWLVTNLVLLIYQMTFIIGAGHMQNFKISPKPCEVNGLEGTCMFVWECIKSEGQHVGMCVDSFMFGSCCAHNLTENVIFPQTFSYTRPTKTSLLHHTPLNSQKPKPPSHYKPSISGMTTIERPHGAGTLVIRPSGPHRPTHQKPVITVVNTTTKIPASPSNVVNDLEEAASVAGFTWNTSPQTTQWHVTTEPNFITRPRPPVWEKPTLRPKPSKPSKKPIRTTLPPFSDVNSSSSISSISSSSIFSGTRKPTTIHKPSKPQIFYPRPTKPATSTSKRPTSTILSSLSTSTTHYTKPYTSSIQSVVTSGIISQSSSTLKPSSTSIIHSTTTTTTTRPTTIISTVPSTTTKVPSSLANKPLSTISSSTLGPSTSLLPISTTLVSTTVTSTTTFNNESNEIDQQTKKPKVTTLTVARGVECGVPQLFTRPETRIVGGKNAPFGRWPWQVSVRRTSFFGFSSTHRCGGALINENWIATAGHCVDDLLTSQIRIRVGEYDFSHVQEQLPYIERGVQKKVVHPKYNFFTYEYDLALVKLDQPLIFAPHVSPICLPATDDLLIGMNATVTGWGRLSEGGTLPSVLQEVSVPIVSNDRCKSMFLRAGRQEFIPDIFLCAGYENGGQDSCQGDSGGPLQVKADDGKYFLAGIISWGIGCAEANLPGVCTRISKFVPWIMENVT